MLSEGEITGIRDLLARLDEDVVYSLADTATKKALAFSSINDAVNAITLHSESASWLLNRKKLTRAMLFEYLNFKKIPISGKAEKSDIITRVLELWTTEPKYVTIPATTVASSNQQQSQNYPAVMHTHGNVSLDMGLKFAQWFYEILLAVHKQIVPGTKLTEQFWQDVRLKITVNSSENSNCHEVTGSDEAANILHILLCQHGFLLNPNLTSDGVRERKDPHGMVIIGVCGTAHQSENCSGIFEQVFGLLQDPSVEFHWRIKWSELRITQAAVNRLPCLTDLPELQAICDDSIR